MPPRPSFAAARSWSALVCSVFAIGAALPGPAAAQEEVYVPVQAQEVHGYIMVHGVNARTGNFAITYPAFDAHGVPYRRTYNSKTDNTGTFGLAWGSTFDTRAVGMADGRVAVLENGNGALTVYGPGPEGEIQAEMERAVAAAVEKPSDAPRAYIGARFGIENAFAQEDAVKCGTATLAAAASGYLRQTCADRFEFFDEGGRLTRIVENGGQEREIEISRDASGRIVAVSDDDGHKLSFERTATTLKVTDETGGWANYEFDARGRNTRITASHAPAYTFAYDAAGLLTQIAYVDGTALKVAYDADGRVAKLTTREGDAYEFRYRPEDRETLVIRRPFKGEASGMLAKFLD